MARQQAAFAASCFRCSKPAFAASCTSSAHSAALRLEGLRLRSIAFTQPTHQPALDRSGTLRFAVLLRTLSVGLQAAARCTQLVQPPAATFRCSPQAPKSLHPPDTAAAKKKSCSNAERVQAKRRLRTAAALTLWASVQPGAFSDCALRLLACLNWRLALLIGTLALARLVWRMRNQLSDKPAAQRTMSEYQQTFHMLSTEEDWSVDQPFTIQSTRLCCCGV